MTTTEAGHAAARRGLEDQLVTFCLGDEEFGFDIMSVQEIIRQPALSRLPMAPDYVAGIANLRGTVLPIIDTRARFGMPRAPDTDRTRVLVVDVNGVKAGLRVDSVRQVTRIQASDVEAPPAVVRQGLSAECLKGVVKLDGGRRIIMSLRPEVVSRVSAEGAVATESRGLAAESSATAARGGEAPSSQCVSFSLGDEEFAFPMEAVREILRMQRPCEVPDSPAHLLGILTVRGSILPVIDLRVLLGMRDLADEVTARVGAAREGYARWVDALARRGDEGAREVGVEGAEALRGWIGRFTTSSQAMMETLGAMRIANDKAQRGVAAREPVEREVLPFAREALRRLDELAAQVAKNIHEDQRLVVVQSGGARLALLVDRVREVLSVPAGLVDPPPRVTAEGLREVRGVARLQEGRRLIMLLDAERLVSADALEAAQRAAGGDMGEQGARSERAAVRASAGGERQFVTFRLGDGEYGIPIHEIQEIDRASKMTRIPRSADYVDGVTNLRGEVIPVVNARRRFGLPPQEVDERTRVIILDVAGRKTGLLVDAVREVLSLGAADVSPPPPAISEGVEPRFIAGIGRVSEGRRMVVLLHTAAVVHAEG